jgi:hypothetical protein
VIAPSPSLVETIQLMRIEAATDEEWDLLASIEHANDVHQPTTPDDPRGAYGACVCCELPWPCRMWNETFVLAVEWTSRRAGDACDRAKQLLIDLPDPIAPKQRTKAHLKVIK